MGDERAKAVPLYLAWLGTLCGGVLILLSDALPVRLGFVRPDTFFVCLTEIEVAFVLFVWPLFIPSLLSPVAARRGVRLLLDVAVLLVAALPLDLIAANISNVDLAAFFRARAVVGSVAAFAAALAGWATGRWRQVGPWFVLGAFAVSAMLPFLAFILPGADLAWLASVSPFWAAARLDTSPPLMLAAILGALTALLLAASVRAPKAAAA